MSLINIINESFDKRNKSILTESKLTQLRKAFGEVADSYDTEELLSSIFPQFARKAYKIVKNHGYSGVFSEIDTQGDLGDDFFYANKDGKSYMGSYNYQQELDDITEIVLFGKATTYKELIDELAEWYANLILSKLEFDSDDEWDESEWVISEGYTKSSKSKVTKNKALHESLTDQDKGHIVTEIARLMDKSGKDLEDVLYDLSYIYNDENWVPIIGRFIDDDSPDLDAVDDFVGDELGDDSLDIYDHVKRYKKYITDPEILKKYGKRPNYVTQLKTAFKRVDDTYDLSVLVDDLMYGFYEKTRKILASKGFTNFSSEPSTENMMGEDFFWAEKDGVKYEGSYDFETELEDISDFVINSNATTRKDLFNELAEWYADFVLSTLEPIEDDEDDEDDDLDENIFIKKQKRKSQKLKEAQGDFNPATLKKYGVVRDPANDFVDDGDRFTAYLYKGVIPISYLKSKGQVYLSIAFHDLDDVNYDEYKNFESYQDGDKYNGVPADSVDIEDFVSILERAKKDYEEFKASVKAPNIDDYKAFRKVYADYFKKVSERAKKLIADNIDTIADLSDYELKKIFEYYKSIKSQLSRWINDDAISQMSPSAIRHDLSPESIERQKKQIANVDDYFYLRYIRDYIEGDKAK